MKKLLIGTALVATIGMTGCTANATTSTSYADIVESAKAAHAKAKTVNNVWKQKKMKQPYVDTYLAKADEAKKKGDDAAAMKYAKQAYKSAHAEVAQMESWKGMKAAWEK